MFIKRIHFPLSIYRKLLRFREKRTADFIAHSLLLWLYLISNKGISESTYLRFLKDKKALGVGFSGQISF